MKKNIVFAIALWLISTALMSQTAIVPQGSGSQNDPYQIETWENIYWLSENADAWDKHFEQTADIEFPEDIVNWDNSKGLNSIGAGYNDDAGEAYPFTGHYDGQNFSISNVYINRGEEYAEGMGLFGAIENASLKNIKLNNVHIIGYTQVGGLVGSSWLGEIENTQVSGYVKGRENVGGLAGQSFNGTITKSFTNTQVEGADSWWAKFIGGFIGSNSSIITECFSSGTVEGRLGVGGFAGENIRVQEEEVKIENCFSLTSVTVYQEDAEWYGGFVGDIQSGKINKCYSVGNVSYLNGTAPNNVGFVGNITSTGSNFEMNGNYWDTETSRQTSTQGSTDNGSSLPQGKTTAEMKNINTFTGWDFTNIWQIDAEINSGYPYLKFAEVSMPVGSGSEENPFVIATLGNLRWFAEQVNVFEGKYFVQTQNIDATATQNWNEGEGWKPKAYFKGTYNGNGFTIDGLFMNADRSAGLFDYIENATIKNLGLTNVDLTGSMYSAGLVGTTDASNIENCYVTGSVKGSDEVGGLIGRNGMNTAIAKAYFNGIITGEDFVGGLIGRNDGNYNTSVSCCYSAGTVKGDRFVGGFVGANYKQTTIEDCYSRSNVVVNVNAEYFGGFAGRNENAAINKCYSTGIVDYENEVTVYSKGFVGSCVDGNDYYMRYNYWDTESSAQVSNLADENAATGLTTSQMKTRESFIGWDFENTWVIDAGINDGYPTFSVKYTLTISIVGDGIVNVNDKKYTAEISVDPGTTLNLEAIADNGWQFEGWTGSVDEALEATTTITMNEDKTVYVTFVEESPAEHTITFTVTDGTNPIQGASIAINNQTITTNASGVASIELPDGSYPYTITLNQYETYNGTIEVNGDDVAENVSLVYLSAQDNILSSVLIRPNPFSNSITIANASMFTQIIVVNTIGQTVIQQNNHRNDTVVLSTQSLNKGIYMVILKTAEGKTIARKVIKQ